ncbi:MAG: phytoene desaturase [Spirochaetales bacterium]|nr:phytoene desaturase [Spirochaetales bacterium]
MGGKAIVVGAGLGGLSAAANLAAAGWRVEVYEQGDGPGGKATEFRLGDYRWDAGPSLVTMPQVFRATFARFGRRLEDYLTLVPLDRICAYFWPDGSSLGSSADTRRFGDEVDRAFGSGSGELERYLAGASRLWRIAGEIFLERPIHEIGSWLGFRTIPKILGLPFIDPLRSLHARNASSFRDARLVQLFDRYATYNGSNPWRTPGTMGIIPHVEYEWGGWTVLEGIHAIPRALERVARELGVEFRYGTKVERILTDTGRAIGVAWRDSSGRRGETRADAVVSDVDVLATWRELLGMADTKASRRYARLEPSSSGVVFYWGMARRDARLGVNNIFFSKDYAAEFRAIFDEGRLPDDPTVYVNITGRVTPGDAPPDGDNWFVLVNAPPDRGQDWPSELARLRAAVIRVLSDRLGWDVGAAIVEEATLDPARIALRTGGTGGSLYGVSSNSAAAAFRRQANRCREVDGLYFCSGSAHPGGGMPLVLLSGRMAAELADRRYRRE